MIKKGFEVLVGFFRFLLPFVYLYIGFLILFFGMCLIWFLIFKYKYGMEWKPSGQRRIRKRSLLRQLLIDVPRRYVLDRLEREPGYFYPRGIHMFCGEQGCGKTIACVEMMLRYQKMYPKSKMITNLLFRRKLKLQLTLTKRIMTGRQIFLKRIIRILIPLKSVSRLLSGR